MSLNACPSISYAEAARQATGNQFLCKIGNSYPCDKKTLSPDQKHLPSRARLQKALPLCGDLMGSSESPAAPRAYSTAKGTLREALPWPTSSSTLTSSW